MVIGGMVVDGCGWLLTVMVMVIKRNESMSCLINNTSPFKPASTWKDDTKIDDGTKGARPRQANNCLEGPQATCKTVQFPKFRGSYGT